VKKKKHKGSGRPGGGPEGADGEAVSFARPPERIASPFKASLAPLKQKLVEAEKAAAEKAADKAKKPPAPVPPTKRVKLSREEEATALSLAMQGVKPLTDKKASRVTSAPRMPSRTASVAPFGRSAEDEARSRLDALVVHDVKFRVERDSDRVEGARVELASKVVRELARRTRVSDTLDLHGKTQREAKELVSLYVRKAHRLGFEVVCVVHGKGQHSEGGVGVLREAVVDALLHTLAAPLVRAFVTAPEILGGSGALLVELLHR
jgi:DNA-nicking Smr family endonuclease